MHRGPGFHLGICNRTFTANQGTSNCCPDRIQESVKPVVEGYVSALAKAERDASQRVELATIIADMKFAKAQLSVGRDEINAQIKAADELRLPPNVLSYFGSLKNLFYPDGKLTQRTTMFSSFLEAVATIERNNSHSVAEEAAGTLREVMQANWREQVTCFHALRAVVESKKFG